MFWEEFYDDCDGIVDCCIFQISMLFVCGLLSDGCELLLVIDQENEVGDVLFEIMLGIVFEFGEFRV